MFNLLRKLFYFIVVAFFSYKLLKAYISILTVLLLNCSWVDKYYYFETQTSGFFILLRPLLTYDFISVTFLISLLLFITTNLVFFIFRFSFSLESFIFIIKFIYIVLLISGFLWWCLIAVNDLVFSWSSTIKLNILINTVIGFSIEINYLNLGFLLTVFLIAFYSFSFAVIYM